MKLIGVMSAAVLSLTLGVAAPAYAQQGSTTSRRKRRPSLPRTRRKHSPRNR
jgi:hypothetical protein